MHVGKLISSANITFFENLLRWHPTVVVFRMAFYYVRTRTFQFDYLVDKNNISIYLLNDTILITVLIEQFILVRNQVKICGAKY